MMLEKRKPYYNQKIRDAAKDEECTLQGPNCNERTDTTVFCHLNEQWAGKGFGIKSDDIGFFGCSACHYDYDNNKLDDKYFYLLRAVVRTWRRLWEKGLIK